MAKTYQEHRAILDAIECRDAELARRGMRVHIQSNLKDTLASDQFKELTRVGEKIARRGGA